MQNPRDQQLAAMLAALKTRHSATGSDSSERMMDYLEVLKQLVPDCPKDRQVSQLELLQQVINYIGDLQDTLQSQSPPGSPMEHQSFNFPSPVSSRRSSSCSSPDYSRSISPYRATSPIDYIQGASAQDFGATGYSASGASSSVGFSVSATSNLGFSANLTEYRSSNSPSGSDYVSPSPVGYSVSACGSPGNYSCGSPGNYSCGSPSNYSCSSPGYSSGSCDSPYSSDACSSYSVDSGYNNYNEYNVSSDNFNKNSKSNHSSMNTNFDKSLNPNSSYNIKSSDNYSPCRSYNSLSANPAGYTR